MGSTDQMLPTSLLSAEGTAISGGSGVGAAGGSLQSLMLFFIYIPLVWVDKRQQIQSYSRGEITIWVSMVPKPHFGYANTPRC